MCDDKKQNLAKICENGCSGHRDTCQRIGYAVKYSIMKMKKPVMILGISFAILLVISAVAFYRSRSDRRNADGSDTDWTKDQMDNQIENGEQILRYVDAHGGQHQMVVRNDIEKHDYDWTCLKQTENGITYEGDSNYTIRKGIDVSYHQGEIDWNQVKNAGYDFVFVRIAYRGYGAEGTLNADSMALSNIKGAKEAGLDVGVYIFSQAVNEAEAVEEADFVLDLLDGTKLELPVVYDPEQITDDEARTDSVTGAQFTANTKAFCERIRSAGYEPMFYSNLVWEADQFDLGRLKQYPVWYADYESVPQTPYAFRFWQYSESGTVDGINGSVDLDVEFIPN